MIPLGPAAVIEDRRATVCVADGNKAGCHFTDCRFPVDLLVRTIRAPAHRMRDAISLAVLIVVEA